MGSNEPLNTPARDGSQTTTAPAFASAPFAALAVDYAYYNESNIVIKFTTPLPEIAANRINIYHLYPPTTPTAGDGGTDIINLSDGVTASFSMLSSASGTLTIPISDLANQDRFNGGARTLLCLPYEFDQNADRYGCVDPTAGQYQNEYYINPTVYVQLTTTAAPSLNAALRTTAGSVMISMEAYTQPYMRLYKSDLAGTTLLSTFSLSGNGAVILTYGGKSYLSLPDTKNVALGDSIILSGFNGIDVETQHSNTIIVTADDIYATPQSSSNDGANVTLQLSSPLSLMTAFIVITPNGNSAPTYARYTSTTPSSISFPTPAGSGVYLICEKAGSIWSNFQQVAIPAATATPSGSPDVACFFASAPILTPSGYQRIGRLAAGDKVMTGDGRVVAIERVHRSRVAAAPSTNPYVILKGQYGATRRLQISPNHRVQTANGMIEARNLGLEQEDCTGTLDYYNLELSATSDTMVVAGVTVESMAPVRRVVVPFAVFREMVTKQHGAVTPALIEKIKRTCRFLENGCVDCHVLANK